MTEAAKDRGVRQVDYEEEANAGEAEEAESSLSITETMQRAMGRGTDKRLARQLNDEGKALYEQAALLQGSERLDKFDDAREKFETAAARWPDSSLEEDAMFMVGECNFFADRLSDARKAYDELAKKYPNSRHSDAVGAKRYALAQYWLESHEVDPHWVTTVNLTDRKMPTNDARGHALKVLDAIRKDDPTGPLADDATMKRATALFKAGNYSMADQAFSDLRTMYPNSPHQFDAHFLAVKCKIMLYRGPDHAGGPLEEAEKLIETTYKLFPEKAASEREYLQRTLGEVKAKMALRLYTMAELYARRKEYGAARHYYRLVISKYPDTSLATEARNQLTASAGEPDVPPDRFSWLTRRFDETPKRPVPLFSDGRLNLNR